METRELGGMMMAATSGFINPADAAASASTL